MQVSRRNLMGMGAAVLAARSAHAQSASREAAEAGLTPLTPDPNRRTLLKGGTIISMDPSVGDFVQGDILIQGKKITAVGTNLKVSNPVPRVIDASNTILIPGFVDCHRHSWEGVLRRIIPNGDIAKYTATTHQGFAPYYRPRDMYIGNLITALGCIDAGITCIIDNSHNSRSAAHSDAAVQALFDSGIRAVHASGAPQRGEWDHQWPPDLGFWHGLDPARKYESSYNAYAHVILHYTDHDPPSFKTWDNGILEVTASPNNPMFKEMGAKYVLIPAQGARAVDTAQFPLVWADAGFSIFAIL